MTYELFPKVTESGFLGTGVTALINDRNTSLTVPWEVPEAQRGNNKEIVWHIKSEDGTTYTVTVKVNIAVSSGSTTVTYTKGNVVITGGS